MNSSRPIQRYRFGPFQVDPHNGDVWKHGRKLNVQPQPLKVLAMLLERPGELVSREELRSRLWPDGLYVDFEHGLNRSINKLRYVLLDKADSPRFIETVPGHGYRFIAPVELVQPSSNSPALPAIAERTAFREQAPQLAAIAIPPEQDVVSCIAPGESAPPPLISNSAKTQSRPAQSRWYRPFGASQRVALLTVILACAATLFLHFRIHAKPAPRHPRVATAEARRFVYAADYSGNAVLAYAVDPSSGALEPVPGNPARTRQHPYALVLSTPYLYVANRGLGDDVCGDGCNISAYIVDPLSGSLVQLDSSPFPAGMGPVDLVTNPSLNYLYAVSFGSNTLQAYSRLAGVGLRPIGSPLRLGRHPLNMSLTPSGRYLYVSNQDDANISAFAVGDDGLPHPVQGSPFATGLRPRSIAIDPGGRHLYVLNYGVNPLPNRRDACAGEFYGVRGIGCTISAFAIDQQTGALSPLPGSPFESDGINPLASVMDSAGKYLFVANVTSNDVSVYAVDASTGALRPVKGSPFAAGQGPNALTLDWSDSYLYVTNAFSHDITQFAVEDDGRLTLSARPVPAGQGPVAIVAQRGTGK